MAKRNTVNVGEFWNLTIVRSWDTNGVETHHWFDTHERGLIHVAEVVYFNDERHYIKPELMMVSDRVIDALDRPVLNPTGAYE